MLVNEVSNRLLIILNKIYRKLVRKRMVVKEIDKRKKVNHGLYLQEDWLLNKTGNLSYLVTNPRRL